MPKWLMPLIVMLAIGCARTSATAQPAETPPAPPAPPAQPEAQAQQQQADERAAAQAAREEAAAVRARAADQAAQARTRARGALAAQVKKEKAAWIGVVTDRMPAALRQHLQMKHRGIGLIIERVEPKSPAEEAGLMQYDILEKLNDQWLVNSEQFGVLIRMNNPGDEINLSVIRQGQPMQINVKLGEKELPVLGLGGGVWMGQAPLAAVHGLAEDGEWKELAKELEKNPHLFDFHFATPPPPNGDGRN